MDHESPDICGVKLKDEFDRWKQFKTDCNCKDDPKYTCYRCRLSCCEAARTKFCVCLYSFQCPRHFNNDIKCYGSHS